MRIVMVSDELYGQAPELTALLSQKLGWPVTNRDELVEGARRQGIKMGRLAVSMIKAPGPTEKLAREKELYLSFATKALCERAREGDFIYFGRAGHLLLPGVSHRLRVGIRSARERRIEKASAALKMSPERVESCLDRLDEDVGRWNRYVHRADGRDPSYFDLVVNLETMSLNNAATILCATASLPDFQPTPASIRLIDDHLLAARAKLRLALDDRMRDRHFLVHAEGGELTVAYPPHAEGIDRRIGDLLSNLEGCRELVCVMADTNILWVQERFEAESSGFEEVSELAQRWGAAVELLRLLPEESAPVEPPGAADASDAPLAPAASAGYDGGVEDDDPPEGDDDGGLHRTQERLVALGRSGGRMTVHGSEEQIIERIRGRGQYGLVVIGELFLDKEPANRKRLTRELAMSIRDRLKAPVVTATELRSRWFFGKAQAGKLVGFAALVALIYGVVFTNQETIQSFLGGPLHQDAPWLSSLAVGLSVPIVASLYGAVAGLVLKMMRID